MEPTKSEGLNPEAPELLDHDRLVVEVDELRKLRALNMQTIREMADDIRQMDQLVYKLSQATSYNGMLPYIQELIEITQRRMRDESNRITGIMQEELLKTYTAPRSYTEPPRRYQPSPPPRMNQPRLPPTIEHEDK